MMLYGASSTLGAPRGQTCQWQHEAAGTCGERALSISIRLLGFASDFQFPRKFVWISYIS